jgi:hypothetical protein
MPSLDPVAKILIGSGFALVILGIAWQMGWLQSFRLFRLPGDIAIEKENMKFYFPITTMILISAVLSLISWLLRR